jgi:hypothetical protein
LIPVRVVCSSDRRPRLSRVAPRRRAPTAAPPRAGPSPHVHDESSTTPCARPRASRIPRRCALAASGPGCSTRRAAGEPMHDPHNEPTILDVAATQLRGTSNRRTRRHAVRRRPPLTHSFQPHRPSRKARTTSGNRRRMPPLGAEVIPAFPPSIRRTTAPKPPNRRPTASPPQFPPRAPSPTPKKSCIPPPARTRRALLRK